MKQKQKSKLAELKNAAQKIVSHKSSEAEKLNLLQSVIANVHDAVVITEAEPISGKGPQILYVNQAFSEMTGYTPSEVLGKTPRFLQGPKTNRQKLDRIRKHLERWQPIQEELINYRKDGTEFWVELNIIPVSDDRGWFTHWISIQRNITEQKKLEEIISSSENDFAEFFDNASIGIQWVNADGNIIKANQALLKLLGYSTEEYIGHHLTEFATADCINAVFNRLKVEGSVHNYESQLKCKDGSLKDILVSSNVLWKEGRFIHSRCFIVDATERKKVEHKLLQQSKALEQLNNFNQQVSSELNVQKTIQAFLRAASSASGAKYSLFYYFDKKGKIHCIHYGKGNKTLKKKFESKLNERSLKKGIRIFENNLIVPVKTPSHELLGGLITCFENANYIDEDVKKFTCNLASQAGIAIDNAQLVQSLKTEKAKARESEQYYRFLTETIPQIIWTTSASGKAEYYNPQWYEYTGLKQSKSSLSNWIQAIHPEDRERCLELWEKCIQNGESYEIEYRIRRASDNSYRWHLGRAMPIKDEGGRITKWFGTSTDIHHQKKAEEERQKDLEQLKFLAESMPQVIWTTTKQGEIEYLNQHWYKYTGYNPAEPFTYEKWVASIHPDDVKKCLRSWLYTIKKGKAHEVEYRFRRKDGKYLWHLARAYPVKDEDGKILKWFGSCTDVDDRKRIEEKTRESEAKFRHLFDSNIIGVFIANVNGQIYEANKAFLEMTGYTEEDLTNGIMSWATMTPPEFVAQDIAMRDILLKGGTVSPFEKEYICKDGKRVSILVGAALFEDNPNLTLAFVLDITERKEIERRKDEFIGMASHELKTPITSMKIFTQMLQQAFKQRNYEGASLYSYKVDEQINKLTKLVIDLLDISKMQEGILEFTKKPFSLNKLVEEVIQDFQASSKKHQLIFENTEAAIVFADRERIEQVITNLLSNAIKYSPHADKVVIKISVNKEDGHVQVSVQDFGIGISPENQRRIFNRFFRVFGRSEKTFPGLGIGLYICSEIINGHDGSIWVESKKGEGSIVSFKLPLQLN